MANGYNQERLAKALPVHAQTISRWERGVREIPSFLKLALGYLELKGDKLEHKLNLKTEK
jgi:transcriptional regulator with XRE-family HTH domain